MSDGFGYGSLQTHLPPLGHAGAGQLDQEGVVGKGERLCPLQVCQHRRRRQAQGQLVSDALPEQAACWLLRTSVRLLGLQGFVETFGSGSERLI